MDIRGIHVIPEPTEKTKEGFTTTIHKGDVMRGPFDTIQEAIKAAHAWADEPNPAPATVTETKSESVAVQVEKPIENPPVIDETKAAETT